MKHTINIQDMEKKNIYSLGDNFTGYHPTGEHLGFTNYYMTQNESPFFGISGEFHFSRMNFCRWEDEIIKMKMGGINIISTYIFWIHHEEIEDEFDFTGCRNLRYFLELCKKHSMYVILRVGPFNHGEVRNGGLPDWLYGKPFEVREVNEGFLGHVRKLYTQIGKEIKGHLYSEGGGIIAAQIDNEYMHSSAPWEVTTGVTNEWVNGGNEGEKYMLTLMELAKECGINVPFYTCTAWGGAIAPAEMMPLWGGYAYRPWLFYKERGEHPSTEEYLYQDFHNNQVLTANDFAPRYLPEEKPYACCEMGGGMMCSYNYRFELPYKSVDAMANIKIASGCNFLGYYVFHGGSNPKGKLGVSLNESQVSKISYDYQAALGEFGQIRESYQRLKSIHYFCQSFGQTLCKLKTMLPINAGDIVPKDLETLRYAVRTDGEKGYVFINNFQDHECMKPKQNESITVITKDKTIEFKDIGLANEENCILPFEMDLDGCKLEWASLQPVTVLQLEKKNIYVFLKPDGMEKPQFCFEDNILTSQGNNHYICDVNEEVEVFNINNSKDEMNKEVEILCVNRELANQMYMLQGEGIVFTSGALLVKDLGIYVESQSEIEVIKTYPKEFLSKSNYLQKVESKILSSYQTKKTVKNKNMELEKQIVIDTVGTTRYKVTLPENVLEGVKDRILKITYQGDIGQAFIDGELVHDNFYNGAPWEISLKEFYKAEQSLNKPLTIFITPIKEGVNVNVESPMAGRMEMADAYLGKIHKVELKPVYELKIR